MFHSNLRIIARIFGGDPPISRIDLLLLGICSTTGADAIGLILFLCKTMDKSLLW